MSLVVFMRLIVLSHWPHVATHVATLVAQLVWQHVASVKALLEDDFLTYLLINYSDYSTAYMYV